MQLIVSYSHGVQRDNVHLSHIRNIFSGLNMFLLGFWHIGCEVVKILVILCMCALPLGFFSVVILDQNGRILCLYCSLKLFPSKSSRWLHSDLCLVNTRRSRFDTWHYFGGKKTREHFRPFLSWLPGLDLVNLQTLAQNW